MKKYILVFCVCIFSFGILQSQDSTKARYDIFSLDVSSFYRTARTSGEEIRLQISYERQYNDFSSLFFSQHVIYDLPDQDILTHTVIGQRNYFKNDLKGYYIGPYASLNLMATDRYVNGVVENDVIPVIGAGLGVGFTSNYKKLNFDIGTGIGIGAPLKDGYFRTPVNPNAGFGLGALYNSSIPLMNRILRFIPSYFNINIGFRKMRKPRVKQF
jgi:hypothetical protein